MSNLIKQIEDMFEVRQTSKPESLIILNVLEHKIIDDLKKANYSEHVIKNIEEIIKDITNPSKIALLNILLKKILESEQI